MNTHFHTTRRIEFGDTDMAGIVHFANFFRFMEAAEQEFLRSLGLSAKLNWEGEDLGFPRVAASCDYLKPARFEDLLDVEVSVQAVGRKSITYSFAFSRSGDTIAKGEVSAVCCRVLPDHGIESMEIPLGIRERLQKRCRPA